MILYKWESYKFEDKESMTAKRLINPFNRNVENKQQELDQ